MNRMKRLTSFVVIFAIMCGFAPRVHAIKKSTAQLGGVAVGAGTLLAIYVLGKYKAWDLVDKELTELSPRQRKILLRTLALGVSGAAGYAAYCGLYKETPDFYRDKIEKLIERNEQAFDRMLQLHPFLVAIKEGDKKGVEAINKLTDNWKVHKDDLERLHALAQRKDFERAFSEYGAPRYGRYRFMTTEELFQKYVDRSDDDSQFSKNYQALREKSRGLKKKVEDHKDLVKALLDVKKIKLGLRTVEQKHEQFLKLGKEDTKEEGYSSGEKSTFKDSLSTTSVRDSGRQISNAHAEVGNIQRELNKFDVDLAVLKDRGEVFETVAKKEQAKKQKLTDTLQRIRRILTKNFDAELTAERERDERLAGSRRQR